MKHHSLFSLILTAAATSTILAGCSSDPILPDKAELYNREFIKTFGVFDLSHDWNFATQTSVTVTTAVPTDIKVCARFDGTLYSFGEYTNVEGTHTLNVDIPKGITDLIIRANGRNYAVRAGGEISLCERGSKTFASPSTTDDITFDVTDETKTIPASSIKEFLNALTEGGSNINKEIEGKTIISNFSFTGTGKALTFYPLYWNTNSYHALGIYWYDEDGNFNANNMMDLYYTKSGEIEYSTDYAEETEYTYTFYADGCSTEVGEECPTHNNLMTYIADKDIRWGSSLGDSIWYISAGSKYHIETRKLEGNTGTWNPEMNQTNQSSNVPYYTDQITGIRTKGISLTVKEGIKYGFYLKVNGSNVLNPDSETSGVPHHIAFSQAQLNQYYGTTDPDYGIDDICGCTNQAEMSTNPWSGLPEGYEDHGYVQASYTSMTIDNKNITFFAFEDWREENGGTSPDLNDIVFMFDDTITPDDIEVKNEDEPDPEPEPWEWIIACEDLGTNDFDFNDVVFSVSDFIIDAQDPEKATIKVTALAAGGTLPVYLHLNGNVLYPDGMSETDAEFHKWFDDGYGPSTVINAASLRATGKSATVTVKPDFTMECCQTAKDENMGGFQVEVRHTDGTKTLSAINPNVKSSIGSAPQMICVPHTWCWPKENVFISNVYPLFTDWCASQYSHNDWHETRNSGYWER